MAPRPPREVDGGDAVGKVRESEEGAGDQDGGHDQGRNNPEPARAIRTGDAGFDQILRTTWYAASRPLEKKSGFIQRTSRVRARGAPGSGGIARRNPRLDAPGGATRRNIRIRRADYRTVSPSWFKDTRKQGCTFERGVWRRNRRSRLQRCETHCQPIRITHPADKTYCPPPRLSARFRTGRLAFCRSKDVNPTSAESAVSFVCLSTGLHLGVGRRTVVEINVIPKVESYRECRSANYVSQATTACSW